MEILVHCFFDQRIQEWYYSSIFIILNGTLMMAW